MSDPGKGKREWRFYLDDTSSFPRSSATAPALLYYLASMQACVGTHTSVE